MPILLGDTDLQRLLPPERALLLVREALAAVESGRLLAPARVAADVGIGRLTFTCGAVPGEWVGYRSYLAPGDRGDEQVVVVQDVPDGSVTAVYAGRDLGPRRTGAIGGVACDVLAREGSVDLGMVGTGRQAWEQVVAIHAARGVERLRVWSPTREHREAFADRARTEVGVEVLVGATARATVEGASVVCLATSAASPVVDVAWLEAATLVSTLGPKQVGRHEFPLDLVDLGGPLVTDSLGQLRAYDPPFALAGHPVLDRVVSLGSMAGTRTPARGEPGAPAVFFSVGLAGTEAALLRAITSGDP